MFIHLVIFVQSYLYVTGVGLFISIFIQFVIDHQKNTNIFNFAGKEQKTKLKIKYLKFIYFYLFVNKCEGECKKEVLPANTHSNK